MNLTVNNLQTILQLEDARKVMSPGTESTALADKPEDLLLSSIFQNHYSPSLAFTARFFATLNLGIELGYVNSSDITDYLKPKLLKKILKKHFVSLTINDQKKLLSLKTCLFSTHQMTNKEASDWAIGSYQQFLAIHRELAESPEAMFVLAKLLRKNFFYSKDRLVRYIEICSKRAATLMEEQSCNFDETSAHIDGILDLVDFFEAIDELVQATEDTKVQEKYNDYIGFVYGNVFFEAKIAIKEAGNLLITLLRDAIFKNGDPRLGSNNHTHVSLSTLKQ